MTRVMLVDDHAASREPLAFMLDREPDLEVVAEAASLAEGREMLEDASLRVDLALIDLDLPDGDGAELIGALHAANPRVVAMALTHFTEQEPLVRAIEAGAAGVLHKSASISKVLEAVRRLRDGEHLLSPPEVLEAIRLAAQGRRVEIEARGALDSITPREREVLQALAKGLNDREIADNLHIRPGTVRTHINGILAKLGVHSRLQAVVFAVRHGAVKID